MGRGSPVGGKWGGISSTRRFSGYQGLPTFALYMVCEAIVLKPIGKIIKIPEGQYFADPSKNITLGISVSVLWPPSFPF